MSRFYLLLALLISGVLSAQQLQHQSLFLNPELQKFSNATVRNEIIEVHIEAVDKMRIVTRREVTIFNEKGRRYEFAAEHYNKNRKIKSQSAVVYDKMGNELEKFRQKDFVDQSSVPNGTLYSDDRVSYLRYTPKDYPYTLVYESEVQTGNTIFLNDWRPVPGYYLSVEKASYRLFNPAQIPIRYRENQLDSLQVEKKISEFEFEYSLKNFPAYAHEDFAPAWNDFMPKVEFAPDRFALVGVEGSGGNWKDFGKWQYEHLLSGRTELPAATVEKISRLTSTAANDIEKAQIIYDYVQQNTRYISVQLGIGGWEPIAAMDVDQLKYGDCKGLTNYTKALLESQGIESYYALVYGDEDKRDIQADFPSMQGNHVILTIPSENEDIWLECTSQTLPFNYLGDFTDDRNVLLVKPEGGEIARTPDYPTSENFKRSHSFISLEENGSFSAEYSCISRGIPYGNIYGITTIEEKDQILYYKDKWGQLNELEIQKPEFKNNRIEKEFLEEVSFSGNKLLSKAGSHTILPLHFFSPQSFNLSRIKNRRLPVQISRGRVTEDIFEYLLPKNYGLAEVPQELLIESKFGKFLVQTELSENEKGQLFKVRRELVLNKGTWPPASYPEFLEFVNAINSAGNQKVLLTQLQ